MRDWTVPQIDLERCDRCGACVAYCPPDAVEMGPDGPFIARPKDCTYCTECGAICPQGAIACPYEIVWGVTSKEGSLGFRMVLQAGVSPASHIWEQGFNFIPDTGVAHPL